MSLSAKKPRVPISCNILISKAKSDDKSHSDTHSLPFIVIELLRFSGLRSGSKRHSVISAVVLRLREPCECSLLFIFLNLP